MPVEPFATYFHKQDNLAPVKFGTGQFGTADNLAPGQFGTADNLAPQTIWHLDNLAPDNLAPPAKTDNLALQTI